jgi:Sec-independent protein translocase protein TatA
VLTLENKHTKGRRRRKRKPDPMNSSPISKVPAVVRRMNEAEKRLSIFRGKGDWKAHKDAIQQLRSQYAHDEDNAVIILLLDYEDAAAACEKNEIETAMKMVNNLGKHMGKLRESQSSVTQESDSEHINDIYEIIYCKCLFLASRLHCMKKDFGKAEKALKKANEELTEYNNAELKAQLHLANAHYQLFVNQSHQTGSKSELAKHVIEHTKKAEHTCAVLKNERYVYDKIRRKILLLRCKAIMQFYLDDGDKKEFATLFNNSIEELESHLWDGISPRQKVCRLHRRTKICTLTKAPFTRPNFL